MAVQRRYCCTIGFFDGVHLGHRHLFRQLHQCASDEGLQPVIYTFRQHPLEVLRGKSPAMLTTWEERLAMLQTFAEVRVLDFREVQHLTAEQFMQRLKGEEGVEMLLMGYDHHFGSDRLTDFADYQHIATHMGLRVQHADECMDGCEPISSSRIRRAIERGHIEDANRMLGYEYAVSGKVIHGNGIGRSIGFPTANIDYPCEKLLPLSGVYAARVGQYAAIVNVGNNPTVGNTQSTVEAHILNHSGSLYDEYLTIQFQRFIRGEQHFRSLAALGEQIRCDIRTAFPTGSAIK